MATKILIIEDTEDIRAALVISFTEEGFRVAAAATGEEAFSELAKFTPDVVLLDMQLPGMSGIDVLRELRKTLTIPILMFTNSDGVNSVRESIAAGATAYILKETGMDELITRVKTHIDGFNARSSAQAAGTAAQPKILYVGEDRSVMGLISATAKRLMIESTHVSTAKVAMSRIRQNPPAIVVADVELRGSDGLTFLKECRGNPDSSMVPVIMVAEAVPPEIRRSALGHGAAAFYSKPVSAVEFEQLVRKLLRSKNSVGAA